MRSVQFSAEFCWHTVEKCLKAICFEIELMSPKKVERTISHERKESIDLYRCAFDECALHRLSKQWHLASKTNDGICDKLRPTTEDDKINSGFGKSHDFCD